MLEAFSLAWGLIVPAEDCSHSSFKDLGLLCPVCKDSVFLVSSSVRAPHSRKKKDGSAVAIAEQQVASHFSHHPNISKSQVAQCELKLSRLSAAQRKAIESKGRNQRRTIFQRHFWKIVMTSHRYSEFDNWKDEARTRFVRWGTAAFAQSEDQAIAMYDKILGGMVDQFRLPAQVIHTKQDIERALLLWRQLAIDESLGAEISQALKPWVEQLNIPVQAVVVSEAIDYLCGDRQRPMLADIIAYSLSNYLHAAALSMAGDKGAIKATFNSLEIGAVPEGVSADPKFLAIATDQLWRLKKADFDSIFYYVRDDVVQALSMVMWRDRFAEYAAK